MVVGFLIIYISHVLQNLVIFIESEKIVFPKNIYLGIKKNKTNIDRHNDIDRLDVILYVRENVYYWFLHYIYLKLFMFTYTTKVSLME